MFDGLKHWCDAEIKSRVTGHATAITWKRCKDRAYWKIGTSSGIQLHYCNNHKGRIDLGSYEGFKPGPFAEWATV